MEKKDANDQIFANQVAGMPLDEAIFQAGYSAGVDFQKGRQTGAVLRETIEDILLKTGKHNQDECSELADMILNDLPIAPTGAVWVKEELERPDCLKVRFKDCYGNIFIGNYSKETNSYYAYGISKEIVNVIEWKPQK
jgi:hypothetical protein